MLPKLQNFFLELRESDEMTKKRWLFILTSSSMLVVVTLWIFYLNLSVKDLNKKELKNSQPEFLLTLKHGMGIIAKQIGLKTSETLDNLKSMTSRTNSITVQGANLNFILNDLEPIQPKKFP